MKKINSRPVFKGLAGQLFLGSILLCATASSPLAAPVGQVEAERVAQVWYGQSLVLEESQFTDEQLSILWRNFNVDRVRYVLEEGEIGIHKSDSRITLAYIIDFPSGGFVVVAADDRIKPVIMYSLDKILGEGNSLSPFARHYLTVDFPGRFPIKSDQVDPDWTNLRSSRIPEREGPHGFKDANDVFIHWDTAEWGQGPPYNDVVAQFNGNNPSVPTGCTATAMAIKMRFHSWPPQGVGYHMYSDTDGAVQFSHFVTFMTTLYDWESMPPTSLDGLPTAPEVAELMYHAGVSVDMDYEEGGSGAWPTAYSFNYYFDYNFTIGNGPFPVADPDIVLSIKGGLPVVCSSSDHTVLIDGFRDAIYPFFHLNCGWDGNSNGWYAIYGGFPPDGSDPIYDLSLPCAQPANYVYVDDDSVAAEDGSIRFPYNTVAEGKFECPNFGELWIQEGNYPESITFDRPIVVKGFDGTVVIGM